MLVATEVVLRRYFSVSKLVKMLKQQVAQAEAARLLLQQQAAAAAAAAAAVPLQPPSLDAINAARNALAFARQQASQAGHSTRPKQHPTPLTL